MRLLRLELRSFRNLERVALTPAEGITVVVGDNGQGKTNLLEALYFLCTLKPLRASKLKELVRFGEPLAEVTGRFLLGGAEREVSVTVEGGVRQARVDGKKAASLESYFGGVSVVAFTPDDLAVVKGSPESRRQFLDRAVFNRFPAYLGESRSYGRALKGRNTLLREKAPRALREAFDGTLACHGARLWMRRRALVAELSPRVTHAFSSIGRSEGEAWVAYRPRGLPEAFDFDAADEASLTQVLLEGLASRETTDLERGFTSIGPHADDLKLQLAGRSARAYASQGQQRAMVIAWKVAEIENLEESGGVRPMLLLDDVSSELDPERNAYLMRYVAGSGAQTVLTTTDAGLVQAAAGDGTLWLHVRAGGVMPLEVSPDGSSP